MHTQRSRPRIAPKDFRDFQIHLEQGDATLKGHLGNISEEGLCIIASPNSELPDRISGRIVSHRLSEPLEFQGGVVWKSINDIRGAPSLVAGVQFDNPIDLPDVMIALSIAVGD